MSDEGASNNELLLAACKNDQDDMLADIFKEGSYDINFRDGAGNTAAHYAAKHGSLDCLEMLVKHDSIDLDIKNTLEGDTPLHKAVEFDDDPDVAIAMVEILLEAEADPRIKNRNQLTPIQLVNPNNVEMKNLLDSALVSYQVGDDDIVDEDDYGDDDEDDIPSDEE
ncbi:ankyrin repeat-containing domain protein [Umbelopsis sp. PMI_123]|nr:ankyrin repeat-containing domain protein [Umbelopsis sp. PMI_123]